MAVIYLNDNTMQTVSPEKGLAIWRVMSGQTEGTPKQQAYIRQIKRLYLNWYHAPADYKQKYPRTGRPLLADTEWMHD